MEFIGVPFDLCGHTLGSRLGPSAVRLAGLAESLTALREAVFDKPDVEVPLTSTQGPGLKHFDAAWEVYGRLFDRVAESLAANRTPLVIGGDHSISIASVSAALAKYGADLGLFWIDAHADLNTPDTSPSGNLHGMSVAALLSEPTTITGAGKEQWERLCGLSGHPLNPVHAGWIGLRDVDWGEAARIKEKAGYASTMNQIDRNGIVSEMERWHRAMVDSGVKYLWLSFDVDVLDPFLAPGTGTAVRGGLTYREMHLMAEMLHEFLSEKKYELIGLDLVETNPLNDTNNATAKVAVEFIGSLFGKTILGAPKPS